MVVLINPNNWPRGSSRILGLFVCAQIHRKGHLLANPPMDIIGLFTDSPGPKFAPRAPFRRDPVG